MSRVIRPGSPARQRASLLGSIGSTIPSLRTAPSETDLRDRLAFIVLARKGRDYELPFGTFLGAGALLVVFLGTPALEWYQSLLRMR